VWLFAPLSTIQITTFQKMHYRKQELCRVLKTHGEAQKTLGKGFAECYIRQTAHDVHCDGKSFFAECFLSCTRQRLCRVLKPTLGKKKVKSNVTARRRSGRVCRVSNGTGTRQRCHVCRVSTRKNTRQISREEL